MKAEYLSFPTVCGSGGIRLSLHSGPPAPLQIEFKFFAK